MAAEPSHWGTSSKGDFHRCYAADRRPTIGRVGALVRDEGVSKNGPEGAAAVSDEQTRPGRARGVLSGRHELAQWLANPLVVTVVAAVLGSFLIPYLTRSWQDHQKALEIKTSLVSQMSESVSDAVATGRFIAADLVQTGSAQQAWNDGYREWTTASASIGARLQAYVGPEIGADWRSFADVVENFFRLSANTDNRSRRQQVEEIARDPGLRKYGPLTREGRAALTGPRSTPLFRAAYEGLAERILQREDELVQRVLDSDVSGF
jgi:hypothetical protein